MSDRKGQRRDSTGRPRSLRSFGEKSTTVLLIVIAVILAIMFFYATNRSPSDRRAEAVTDAATSIDNATTSIGTAARNMADDLQRRP